MGFFSTMFGGEKKDAGKSELDQAMEQTLKAMAPTVRERMSPDDKLAVRGILVSLQEEGIDITNTATQREAVETFSQMAMEKVQSDDESPEQSAASGLFTDKTTAYEKEAQAGMMRKQQEKELGSLRAMQANKDAAAAADQREAARKEAA